VPVVAAIHGPCLGGGLEVALACHGRVCSDSPRTKLGLPEVQLGILPGMGGTQRLPRIIGLEAALDMLLTGRQLDPRRARKVALVDEVVPSAILEATAARRALQLAENHQKGKTLASVFNLLSADQLKELAIAENPLGRKVVFDQARKKLLEKTKGNYPAPERILQVVRAGLESGDEKGFAAEAEAFGELVVSPESAALRHIYFSQQALKKDAYPEVQPKSISSLGVLGAGLMGAGVVFVSLVNAGVNVRWKDVSGEGVQSGLRSLSSLLDERVKRRRMSPWKRKEALARVTRTTEDAGFRGADVVIEAVFEDLDLKRRVLAEMEEAGGENTIFASNTSSLPISDIAKNARAPERVIGMHYFSPVQKMPLLEIIETEQTAPWVTKTCVELGKKQGKTVIVVGDGPGFYTTRILAPYLNEAAYLVLEGGEVASIDRELVEAGFPVGPLALLDEVGIDVGAKVARTMHKALGARAAPPPQLSGLLQAGRKGKKNRSGFYDYSQRASGTSRPVDDSVYSDLGVDVPAPRSTGAGLGEPGSVAERCVLAMVNEAMHCLGEGIVKLPRDGDIGAIFGLGFPPFLGGPFHYVQEQGATQVLSRMRRLEKSFGERFAPAPRLVEWAEKEAP